MKKSNAVLKHESKLTIAIDSNTPVFAEDGTDLTQIQQMLAMSPTQRVRYIQSLAQSIVRMQHAIKLS